MHHNVFIHHLQVLLHASVVDLFSPVQHISERNDLSKATSYFYMESEIAPWRNTALAHVSLCCSELVLKGDFGLDCTDILLTSVSWGGLLWFVTLRYKSSHSCECNHLGLGCRGWKLGLGLRCCVRTFEHVMRFPHELSWTHIHQEEKGYDMHECPSLPSFNLSHFLELRFPSWRQSGP